MEPIIKVENFSKIYGSFRAVDNISFEVEEAARSLFWEQMAQARVQLSIHFVL